MDYLPIQPAKTDEIFQLAARKLRLVIEKYPDQMPAFTHKGKWRQQEPGWTSWCDGFLGGSLWLVFLYNKDKWFRTQAEYYTRLVEARKHDRSVHDLGFIFLLTWKRWYDVSGDSAALKVVIEAGRTLASRYQDKGKYMCSFQGQHSLYIDIMMNIPLIFESALQTGDERLGEIARQHCLTTQRFLVRGDDSTAHEGIFDVKSGQFIRYQTQQGWRDDSTWARGQAWAINGFAAAYAYTQDLSFLHTAERLADFYLLHTNSSGIPPNDWDEPDPLFKAESSAAAVAANGFICLAKLSCDPLRRKIYQQYTLRILDTLCSPEYLSEDDEWEGLLRHGIYHLPANIGVDESTSWGDYYFLEALCRASGTL